jgi:hypothetical protein
VYRIYLAALRHRAALMGLKTSRTSQPGMAKKKIKYELFTLNFTPRFTAGDGKEMHYSTTFMEKAPPCKE